MPTPLQNLPASAYTLTNGSSTSTSTSERPGSGGGAGAGRVPDRLGGIWMDDVKFKFQRDDQLPKPRPFEGVPKRYRAGRGSSVPLDLGRFG